MIEPGDRVLLIGEGREFFVKAGPGKLSTDKGQLELESLVGASGGDIIETHSGAKFTIRIPRPTDFFAHGKRSGAPMLPKDIGLVIAYTGMNHNDDVLDAGTGQRDRGDLFWRRRKDREDLRGPARVLHARDEEHHRGETHECRSGRSGLPRRRRQLRCGPPRHAGPAGAHPARFFLAAIRGISRVSTRRSSSRWRSWWMGQRNCSPKCTPTN